MLLLSSSAGMAEPQSEPPLKSVPASDPRDIFENPPNEVLTKEIDSLIQRLDYPDHAERRSVTQKLIEINAPALPQLRTAYRKTNDLEVGLRIEEIVHEIYFDYHVFNRNGFLGIRMAQYVRNMETTKRGARKVAVPEGRSGMRVVSVIKESGAARAGLLANDVIIAIDDVPLQGVGRHLTESFSASIRSRRPGKTMVLTVVRRDKILTIPATLGRTPLDAARGKRNRVTGTTELYHEVRERFPAWWASHFRVQEDPSGATEGRKE